MHLSVLYRTHTSPAPTGAPVTAAPTPPVVRRLASEPDQYGSVGIMNLPGDNPQYLTGTISGANFGEGVAISEDGSTVAVGSPGNNMVQVFRIFEGSWLQEGGDITKASLDLDADFGFRVGLSFDGNALAVAAPLAGVNGVGAIYVYDWDPSENDWDEGMAEAYGMSDGQKLGINGVVIDPTNLLLHAVGDLNDDRNSFEVCSFSFPYRIERAFFGKRI